MCANLGLSVLGTIFPLREGKGTLYLNFVMWSNLSEFLFQLGGYALILFQNPGLASEGRLEGFKMEDWIFRCQQLKVVKSLHVLKCIISFCSVIAVDSKM